MEVVDDTAGHEHARDVIEMLCEPPLLEVLYDSMARREQHRPFSCGAQSWSLMAKLCMTNGRVRDAVLAARAHALTITVSHPVSVFTDASL